MPSTPEEATLNLPSLTFLEKERYYQNVESMYQTKKDELFKKYPVLKEYPDEMMPVFISYFILYKHAADLNDFDTLKYLFCLRDIDLLTDAFNEAIPALSSFMSALDIEPEDFEDKYEEFKNEQKMKLERDPRVIKFMNSVYNPMVKNAIHNYVLANRVLSFESIGIKLEDKEASALTEYIFYKNLYESYKLACGYNPYYRIKFRFEFKRTTPENMNYLAYTFLSSVEEELLTFEEYVQVITNRQVAIMELITFSFLQQEEYDAATRTRIEVIQ